MTKLSSADIKYLTFEGGGGKGAAYIGALRKLQEGHSPTILPIQNKKINMGGPPTGAQVRGVSGASAGAITALLVAMGLTADEIESVSAQPLKIPRANGGFEMPKRYPAFRSEPESIFECFFDFPRQFLQSPDTPKGVGLLSVQRRTVEYDEITNSFKSSYKAFVPRLDQLQDQSLVFPALFFISNGIKMAEIDPILDKIFAYEDIPTGSLSRLAKAARNLSGLSKGNPNREVMDYFINGLLYQKGVFSGFGVRWFFEELINTWLKKKFSPPVPMPVPFTEPEYRGITFEQFYRLTGVDLVVVGTNITKGRPQYFSKKHTATFPVAEAVAISMNIPILYKPIEIIGHGELDGEYVDGGMLTNLPIHAFDENSDENANINPNLLGFRLEDGFPEGSTPHDCGRKTEEEDDARPKSINLFDLVGELLNTFMYPAEEGQIRTEQEREQIITLYSYCLSTTNFTPTKEAQAEAIRHAYNSTAGYLVQVHKQLQGQ